MDPTDPHLPAGTLSLGVRSSVTLSLQKHAGGPQHLPQGPKQGRYGWDIEVLATLVGPQLTRVGEDFFDARVLFRVHIGAPGPAQCQCYAKSLSERGKPTCLSTTSTKY
jgi:hypothetical protein